MSTDLASLVGITVEVLGPIVLPIDFTRPYDPISQVFSRGDRLTLDPGVLDAASLAEPTAPVWAVLDDEDAQRQRWGRVMIRRATARPVEPWEDTRDPRYAAAYRTAWRALRAMPEGPDKRAQVIAFAHRFPTAPADGQEIARYDR